MTTIQRLLPWFFALLTLGYLASAFTKAPTQGEYDLDAFGRIAVSADGRVKPLDTVARNSLMRISGRQTFEIDTEELPAIHWLADVLAQPDDAMGYQVFRIDHPDVLNIFELTREDGTRFSRERLNAYVLELQEQAQLADSLRPQDRDAFQRRVIELWNKIALYNSLGRYQYPYAVAPLNDDEDWIPLVRLLVDPEVHHREAALSLQSILLAYNTSDPDTFNRLVREHNAMVAEALPGATRRAGYEVLFNRAKPFYHASALYVLVFILSCIGFMCTTLAKPEWARAFARSTAFVLFIAFAVHTIGLASRIYIQGRPPVTNLYSSAVFIGWFAVLLGMIAERSSKLGLASIASGVVGFATLVVAHNLASGGDTMEMMQAVLDSNFWLATHVVAITIGYSATFLAGALGIAFIFLGIPTRLLNRNRARALNRMTYGVICFATLMSFVGTVLGGIWADQSWGRFWGWDPKENGAALIVLMNLLILHARWGGMIKERGVAVLAIFGNIVTAWSWFGTNLLGVGLHSYGFTESGVFWLLIFVASQLFIVAFGLLPRFLWRSNWSAQHKPPQPESDPIPDA